MSDDVNATGEMDVPPLGAEGSSSDQALARQGLVNLLAQMDDVGRRADQARDPELVALLDEEVGGYKLQMVRLLAWWRQRDTALDAAFREVMDATPGTDELSSPAAVVMTPAPSPVGPPASPASAAPSSSALPPVSSPVTTHRTLGNSAVPLKVPAGKVIRG